jgi:hypothetical protein
VTATNVKYVLIDLSHHTQNRLDGLRKIRLTRDKFLSKVVRYLHLTAMFVSMILIQNLVECLVVRGVLTVLINIFVMMKIVKLVS